MRWDGWEGMTSSAARGRGRPAQFKLEFILGGMCLAALGGRSMRGGCVPVGIWPPACPDVYLANLPSLHG